MSSGRAVHGHESPMGSAARKRHGRSAPRERGGPDEGGPPVSHLLQDLWALACGFSCKPVIRGTYLGPEAQSDFKSFTSSLP